MFDLTFVQAAKNNEKYTSNIRTFTPKLCMILSSQNVLHNIITSQSLTHTSQVAKTLKTHITA